MNRVPETPGSSEPNAIGPRTIHVLVVNKDVRGAGSSPAATSSKPELELELLGAVRDPAAAVLSDAEVTRVLALVDVSDAEETDLERLLASVARAELVRRPRARSPRPAGSSPVPQIEDHDREPSAFIVL